MASIVDLAGPFLNIRARIKRKKLAALLAQSADFLNNIQAPGLKPLRGTFIYHRPPDYPGRDTDVWRKREWVAEFKRLQELGIDTVIYQGAIGETTTGKWYIYYPLPEASRRELVSIERRLGKPPVLDPRLDDVVAAAEECGLELHLGLYNVGRGWMPLPDQKFIYQVCREELVVARDLAERYGQSPALNGWYISPEIFYLYHGLLRRLDMRAFLEPICRDLKSATPRARIGISPGTYARKSHHERIKQFWLETLRDTGVDLIYPQDTVGNQFVEVDQAESVWQLWKEIAEALQIELWANCEAFTRINYSSREGCLSAAAFDCFKWQLHAASPHVSRIITWEALYFFNEPGAAGGKALLSDYRRFFNL